MQMLHRQKEPVTEIIGGPELHINKGSTINLTCIVKFAPEPPPTVIWSHNRQVINFDSPRGGISLVTEKGILTTSRLLVQKAIQSDSGFYTCTPSNANPTTVRVHIVDGEHPAAMHHGGAIQLQVPSCLLMLALTFGILTLHYYRQQSNLLQRIRWRKGTIKSIITIKRQRQRQRQQKRQRQQQLQQQQQQQQNHLDKQQRNSNSNCFDTKRTQPCLLGHRTNLELPVT
uniref:Ig-like domain-containing protein n=1 Tax=Glossina austeni TaxID=7395 RepID=A0A1A9UV09_GLOAU